MLEFDELHYSGGNSHVTLTEEQAIAWAKKCSPALSGKMTDQEALDEFIVVNWASWQKEESSDDAPV